MNIILFDDSRRADLFPLTLTRPIAALRCGITTLAEKWGNISGLDVSFYTESYLQKKFPSHISEDNFLINSRYFASQYLWDEIQSLNMGESLGNEEELIAMRVSGIQFKEGAIWTNAATRSNLQTDTISSAQLNKLQYPEDLVRLNKLIIEADFKNLTFRRQSASLSDTNHVLGDSLFVEEGVSCEFATINTLTGPVYLGKNAQVMEGCHIRGPFAMLENSLLKMGSKVYGSTTLGPYSTLGGEVKNSIITGYSNKAHEGYLGDSVLGEWCNLGADTNNSNMKNNYKQVSLFHYPTHGKRETNMQFMGIIMGDHSKSGINATFNTGTVIGVGVNFFGTTLSPSFLPDFTWAEDGKLSEHNPVKMIETARRVFARRNLELNQVEDDLLNEVYTITSAYRKYLS